MKRNKNLNKYTLGKQSPYNSKSKSTTKGKNAIANMLKATLAFAATASYSTDAVADQEKGSAYVDIGDFED